MSITQARKKALVIAVSDYNVNSDLSNLPFCKNDGNEILKILKDLGYEIKNRDGLLGYVDGTNMQNAIYDFFNDDDIKIDDTLLFYFSGHGVPGNDDFFLASSNIELKIPKKKGFSFDDLNGEITHCHAKRLVIILDSCYAGSAKVDGKGDELALASAAKSRQDSSFTEGEGRCLLSSSMGFQESFATIDGSHSFFTNYLLKGLSGAEGKSVNSDGMVTPDSLMQYIDREIDELPKEKRPKQTPLRKIVAAGSPIELAYYQKWARRAGVKGELLSILEQKPSVQRSFAVGLIKHSSGKTSMGFLIGSNIIMTDRNVLPTKESAASLSVEFNSHIHDETLRYTQNVISVPKSDSFELDPDNIFLTSVLGYSIVSTKGNPGKEYGRIELSSYRKALQPKRSLYSIYYVQNHKIIDQNNNFLLDDKGSFNKIIFESEASEMTIGAPIFDTNWNLLAMHGGYRNDRVLPGFDHTINAIHDTERRKRKLEGIRIIAIERELESFCKMENNPMACKILELSH